MAEDSGAFKTNSRNSGHFGHFVKVKAAWQRCLTVEGNAFSAAKQAFPPPNSHKRHGCIAISSDQPDSRRDGSARRGRKRRILWSPRSQWLKGLHKNKKAELASMLPGFRFLFAAIVLSMSILVFGLGAAALLRAAHEQFSSVPLRRGPPETVFAQQTEAPAATLAMVRVEPPAEERRTPDNVPGAMPAEETAVVSAPAEPERTAALMPDDTLLMETTTPAIAKPEIPGSESQPQHAAAPADADAAVSADKPQNTGEAASPSNEIAPAASEQTTASPSADTNIASTKIATLSSPIIATEAKPPAKAADAKPDASTIKKRLQAKRAKERRRLAQRARLEPQQPADPFGLPTATVRSR
jgi:hypothetical protein